MNFKKPNCKSLSLLMALVMSLSINAPAYADYDTTPELPYTGINLTNEHSSNAFVEARGITMGADGNPIVADSNRNTLYKVNIDGSNIVTFANIDKPVGLTSDSSGNIYVSEQNQNNVKIITPSTIGTLISDIVTSIKPSKPGALVVNNTTSTLYGIQQNSPTFTTSSVYKANLDLTGYEVYASGFSVLSGICVGSDGNLYVSDQQENKIIKITAGGNCDDFITNVLQPTYIAVGPDGCFYVSSVSASGNKIIKYDTYGNELLIFDAGSTNPANLCVDKDGYIYYTQGNPDINLIVGSASTVDSTHIALTMNTLFNSTIANPQAFTVDFVTSAPTVTDASISGNVVTLTLSNPIVASDSPVVSYSSSFYPDNKLEVAANNYALKNFLQMPVINNVQANQSQAQPTGLAGVAPTFPAGNGKITGTTTEMEFKLSTLNDSAYTPCSADETTVSAPATYQVRFKAKTGYNAGAPLTLTVPEYTPGGPSGNQNQAAPTGLVGVKPTSSSNKDGKITGTTTDMEFKLSTLNDSAYTPCSADKTTVSTPATYHVRFKAKTGYNAGTPATVKVPRYSSHKNSDDSSSDGSSTSSSSSNSGGSSTTKSTNSVVLVNGKEEKAGTETKSTANGVTSVILTVDAPTISKKIEDVLKNTDANGTNLIEFSVSSSDNATVSLTGDIVKELEKSEFNISISKDKVEYVIPANEITIENIANILNVDSDQLKNIEVEVKINKVSADVLAKYNEIAKSQEHVFVAPPVEFEIVAKATGTDGVTRETTVSQFSNYVERIIEIPANVDPSRITTGIVFNADGTYSHVPTVIFKENGKYYAKLNSLTNSTYSVIYNPITVDTVKGHWAEETVNDMASRLVLIDYKNFAPDKAVTRAEFADYIVRALGLYREGEKLDSTFTDISTDSKYQISIEKAKEWGIISGYPDGTFKADKTVSREEAMVMYAKAMDIANILENRADKLNGYTDKEDVSSWATSSVSRVVNAEIFSGKGNGLLAPKDTLTKAESLTAVRNLLLQAELINK